MNGTLLVKVAATGLAGLVTGALTFVSFVDTRTLLQLVAKDEEITRKVFERWWPNGRDLMMSLLPVATVAHGAAFWLLGDRTWLVSGALLFSIAPYTALILGEDIEGLRNAKGKDVASMTRRFCRLHHWRLVAAAAAFGTALVALAVSK